jgi:enoyl-CoA hydratase/carnithine racemase
VHFEVGEKEDAGNSFSVEAAKELEKIIKAHSKTARALVFTSSHPTLFCSGGDLKAHSKLKNKMAGIAQAKAIRKSLKILAEWPIPKIVFVNGDCFGGGMELLSCFDHRIAAPHVLFGFWQRRVALSFGWGGFERWSKRISPDIIKDLGYSARVFGAHEALRLGLIHQIGSESNVAHWLQQILQWSEGSAAALAHLEIKNEPKLFEKLWWAEAHQKVLRHFNR